MMRIERDLKQGVRWSRTDAHAPFDACRGCELRGSQLCRIIQSEPALGTHPPILRRFSRGQRIFEQDLNHGFLGVIRRGYARRSVIRVSGRRILLGLGIPGDIIASFSEQEQVYDFEAATDIEICIYDSTAIKRQLDVNPSFRRMMLEETDHQHHRLLRLLSRNGTLNSRERIIAFLVTAAEFMPTERNPDGSLILNMVIDRTDWADLTNTAVETISRTLRYLEEKDLVTSLTPYRFRIRDFDLLATIARLEPPALRFGQSDQAKRRETHSGLLKSGNWMTTVNALERNAHRFNNVMKPATLQKHGLAKRRSKDAQNELRN